MKLVTRKSTFSPWEARRCCQRGADTREGPRGRPVTPWAEQGLTTLSGLREDSGTRGIPLPKRPTVCVTSLPPPGSQPYLRGPGEIRSVPEPSARGLGRRRPLHLGDHGDTRGRVALLVPLPQQQHPPAEGRGALRDLRPGPRAEGPSLPQQGPATRGQGPYPSR